MLLEEHFGEFRSSQIVSLAHCSCVPAMPWQPPSETQTPLALAISPDFAGDPLNSFID